jgi:hypothetical protein
MKLRQRFAAVNSGSLMTIHHHQQGEDQSDWSTPDVFSLTLVRPHTSGL